MTRKMISDAVGRISDRHIEEAACYYVPKNNRRRIRWEAVAAACLCLVLGATFLMPGVWARPSEIPLQNYTGNVSIRHTNKETFAPITSDLVVFFSEEELFAQTDYVFSGRIEKIQNIEIDFDGVSVYKSLITITTDRIYKGEVASPSLTILTSPVSDAAFTEDQDLLATLKEGEYGIFLAYAVEEGTLFSENNCSFDASELCEATFLDGVRFGFIQNASGDARCCQTLSGSTEPFSSLQRYDWESVVSYVEKQCEKQ